MITGRFYAPRFDRSGNKIKNARFENIAIDDVVVIGAAECEAPTGGGAAGEVARGPLRFQGIAGEVALADIRARPLYEPVNLDGWNSIEDPFAKTEIDGDFELHARLKIGEGESALQLGKHEIRFNAIGASSARTGSILPGAPIKTDLLQADTWFDLDVRCIQGVLQVSLNNALFNQLSGVKHQELRFKLREGGQLEIADLYWQAIP
jgi:hypothetical protein